MVYSLGDISRHVQGTVHGDSSFQITGLKSLDAATQQDISFVNGEKYLAQAKSSRAGALIVPPALVEELRDQTNVLEVAAPYFAFAVLTHFFEKKTQLTGIASTAKIHETAKIGLNVRIGEYVVIGANVQIADNSCIFPHAYIGDNVIIGHSAYIESHVTLMGETHIGDHVRIHANTSIGGEGFGFAPFEGRWHRIAQLGSVRIGDHVRIGSNCSIDRGALDDTVIDDGVIIDNLVQIAHNVKIGKHTAIAAKCGIAGSTQIGAHCIIGGSTGIVGHIQIVDNVQFTGMSMVTKSITEAGIYSSGTGILENSIWKRAVIGFRQISEMPINKLLKQINALSGRVDQLELLKTTSKPNHE